MEKMLKSCATLGCAGYLYAPGTMGTIVALPLAYGLSLLALPLQIIMHIILFVVSYYIIRGALQCFKTSDPSQIILDEVIGCCVTFFCISYSPINFFVGFLLFRFFDIFKPFGIKRLENIPGALGVLLDDVVAGVLANLLLRFLFL